VKAAVDNCAQSYFNVRLDSRDPSRRGHNGTFNGTDLDAKPENSNITIVNEVRSFSMVQLGAIARKFGSPGGPAMGLTLGFDQKQQDAGFSPYRNFTGNDVRGPDQATPNRPGIPGLSAVEGTPDMGTWQLSQLG
jgi:hypothetical protein